MPLENDIAALNRDFADAYRGLDFERCERCTSMTPWPYGKGSHWCTVPTRSSPGYATRLHRNP